MTRIVNGTDLYHQAIAEIERIRSEKTQLVEALRAITEYVEQSPARVGRGQIIGEARRVLAKVGK